MSDVKQAGPITSFIFAIIFVIGGYFAVFSFGLPMLNEAKASTEWPIVSGKVIYSQLESSKSDGKTMYSPNIQYQYVIEGEIFEGNDVAFGTSGMSSSSSKSARATVNKYKKGDVVNVYYDPNEPYNSVLEPGVTWVNYLILGVGSLFLLIGILMIGGALVKILFGVAIISAALGGLIGKKSKPAQKFPNTTNPLEGLNKTKHQETPLKNNSDKADDGFDIT